MSDFAQLMRQHVDDPFPDGCRGEIFGDVDAVMIDADIYGWSTSALGSRLDVESRRSLQKARLDLSAALPSIPVHARPYYERLVRLADAALSSPDH